MEQHFIGKVATKAILAKDGKVLVVRNHLNDTVWELPGGRVNVGESIETALQRELKEELGIDVTFKRVVYSKQIAQAEDGLPRLFVVCEVTMDDSQQQLQISSDELGEIRWVDERSIKEVKVFDGYLRALHAYWKS